MKLCQRAVDLQHQGHVYSSLFLLAEQQGAVDTECLEGGIVVEDCGEGYQALGALLEEDKEDEDCRVSEMIMKCLDID